MTKVLIVDDQEENLRFLRLLLDNHGYSVDCARNGAEALAMAQETLPALIISDLLMPVMDGYTLLQHWKSDAVLRRVPFIVYTATFTEAGDQRFGENLGADAYIIKPAKVAELIACVKSVLEKAAVVPAPSTYTPPGDDKTALKYYSERLIHKLEEKSQQLELTNRALQQEIAEHRNAEEATRFHNTILQTQQENSLDAILVVSGEGHVLSYNNQALELWGIPRELLDSCRETSLLTSSAVLSQIGKQLEDPALYLKTIEYLRTHSTEKSLTEIHFRDGRIIEVYSAPAIGPNERHYGRIWYYRNVTESRRAKASLEASVREQRQLMDLLEIERSRLLAAQQIAKVGSWETDLATMSVSWTDEVHRIFGTDPLTFTPTHQAFLELVHPDDKVKVDQAFNESISQGGAFSLEHRVLRRDGQIAFVEENWRLFTDEAGKPIRALGTCLDITKRKETEAQLAYLHRVRAVLMGINALIVRASTREELFREACQIAYEAGAFPMAMLCIVNPVTSAIEAVASAGKDEPLLALIRAKLASDSVGETMIARSIQSCEAIVANEPAQNPQVLFGDLYQTYGVHSIAVLPLRVRDKAIGALALYARERQFFQKDEINLLEELAGDIAFAVDHIEKQERLDYLANFDTLTGLANRELFLDRLAQRIALAAGTGEKQCVSLMNIARFKSINDTLGRDSGDILLQLAADWLIRNTGDHNQLARIGADQFAVMFTLKPGGDLIKLFESLNRTLEAHLFNVNDTPLRIAARSGIAVYPDDGTDADSLLRNAEAALKGARASNERFRFYTRDMNTAVASRLMLENQLRQAVSKEDFVLYYQPKADLLTGKITGAEALIRWIDPDGNLALPGKFIAILEETGLINEVGNWALQKALEDYGRWQAAGLPTARIAVNVSPLQLKSRNFIAELEQKLAAHPLAAGGLELEITEGVIMEDIQASTGYLKAIRALGLTIAIDDFGTGFSSLGYLSRLPLDSLKIDRLFIVDMMSGPEGLALVSTIIGLAHALNLKVVAEGVETEEQMRLLRLLKCNELQGYVLGRPMPAEEFERKYLRDDFRLSF